VKVGLCGRYNLSDMSRMNREIHVRICEGLGVKFPWSTRLFCFRGGQKLVTAQPGQTLASQEWGGNLCTAHMASGMEAA